MSGTLRRVRRGDHPTPLQAPAHRARGLATPPTGGTSRGRFLIAAARIIATAATLATVAAVAVTASQGAAVAVDPVPVAFSLRDQTLSAANPADALVATAALAAGDDRREAALAATVRAEEVARMARLAAAAKAQAKAEAQRRAKAEARRAAKAAAARAERERLAVRAARAAARDPRAAARTMLSDFGWGSGQFSCLDSLWQKESGWNVHADNPSSSAYGIPQALPGSKMAGAGPDWRDNPVTQIRWGLQYIASSYGSPCAAWAHSRSHNWY